MSKTHSHNGKTCAEQGERHSLETLISELRGAGLRNTSPRRKVLEVLRTAEQPLTIEEIQKRSVRHGVKHAPPPDFSTIFRTMTTLESLGLVERVNLGRSSAYFELRQTEGHHDHISCVKCGKIQPIPAPCPVETFQKTLEGTTGFTEVRHSLEFFGVCPDCSSDEKRRAKKR